LRYPAFETIVVDDGSTDETVAIAAEFDVQVITTENQGLSAARNVGLLAARGDIVAYLDDDACPDPDWLHFLVETFTSTNHAAVGGPNLPPTDDGAIATCVANAPGGPIQVLISDTEAEHIPGCNMAYRRETLLAINGFDPQFRAAGDDVDMCWRLREHDATLGFHPAAVVWHRRRASVRAFWRQQRGYGHAEALLERKWPERYNRRGHLTWAGRLYDRASARVFRPTRIYHGTWGTGAFQPEEQLEHSALAQLAGAPEWYLVLGALVGLSLLGLVWSIFLWATPLLVLAAAASIAEAVHGGLRADLGRHGRRVGRRLRLRAVTAFLHLLQPAARLTGRLSHGLSPWRQRRTAGLSVPRRDSLEQWHESWSPPIERVARIEETARQAGARVLRGGPYSRWDLEISGGAAGSTRILTSVEEHGRGRQLVRSRVWPSVTRAAWRSALGLTLLSTGAGLSGEWMAAAILLALLAMLVAVTVWECSTAMAAATAAVQKTALLKAPRLSLQPAPTPRRRKLLVSETSES
jgi:GT2 family glycosyltransferase